MRTGVPELAWLLSLEPDGSVVGQHVDLRDEIRKISLDIRLTGGDDSRPS